MARESRCPAGLPGIFRILDALQWWLMSEKPDPPLIPGATRVNRCWHKVRWTKCWDRWSPRPTPVQHPVGLGINGRSNRGETALAVVHRHVNSVQRHCRWTWGSGFSDIRPLASPLGRCFLSLQASDSLPTLKFPDRHLPASARRQQRCRQVSQMRSVFLLFCSCYQNTMSTPNRSRPQK